MQAKLIAAGLLSALPLMASAQTAVTIYGVVDAAVALEDADSPGVKSRTAIHAGQASSRFGFRGTEDLGGGLKAVFNLEGGFAVDTGAGDAAGLFGRRAVVGLDGSFGQVTLGREYTPIDTISSASHILGQGFYGTNLSAFTDGRMTRRISNSINYKSQSLGGFKFSAGLGLGEVLTGPSNNYKGAAAEYQNGPFYAGLGYAQISRLATGDDKEMIAGAAYVTGPWEFKGNVMIGDQEGPNNRYWQWNAGLAYALGNGKLYGNLQQSRLETGARGDGYALTYSYALSKRTNVYTSYAMVRNNRSGRFSLQAAGSTITPPAVTGLGADPHALAVGLRHTF